MYNKLPVKFVGITDNFGMRKHPISGVSTNHYGLDLGWINYKGEPVIASHDGKIVQEGYDSGLGNYVVLRYVDGNNVIINRYLHLKNRAIVKKGSSVIQGQVLGYMGETGYAAGVHLHFEYWVCPSGYSYKSSDVSKYARDPLRYCYLFDDQKVTASSSSKVKKVVGTPIKKNSAKNQIRITGKYLNCRSTPSLKGNVLGYINIGYYNVLDTKTSDGYVWYKVSNNKWVAYISSIVKKYFVNSSDTINKNVTNDDKENTTKNNIISLNDLDSVTDVNNSNDKTNNVDDVVDNSSNILTNYNKFVSEKDDYYYIYLKKDEVVYFPK